MILEFDAEYLPNYTTIALKLVENFDAISEELEGALLSGDPVPLRRDSREAAPALLGALANLRAEITRLEAALIASVA